MERTTELQRVRGDQLGVTCTLVMTMFDLTAIIERFKNWKGLSRFRSVLHNNNNNNYNVS